MNEPAASPDPLPFDPFCLACGYSLQGLALPHPCPECGEVADIERQREEARAWVRSRASWYWFLLPKRKLPVGLLYALNDTATQRMGRRRMFVMWWLPAILCTLLVLIGQQIVIERSLIRYYHEKNDPEKKVHFTREYAEENRPFRFNLHLHGLLSYTPPHLTYYPRYSTESVRFLRTIDFDPFILTFLGPVWIALPGALGLVMLIAFRALKRVAPTATSMRGVPAIKAVRNIMLPTGGLAVWFWLLLLLRVFATDFLTSHEWSYWYDWGLMGLSGTMLAVTLLIIWPRMICLDGPRRVFLAPFTNILIFWSSAAVGGASVVGIIWGIVVWHDA